MGIYDNLFKHVCLPTAVESKEGFVNVSAVLVLVDPFSFFLSFFFEFGHCPVCCAWGIVVLLWWCHITPLFFPQLKDLALHTVQAFFFWTQRSPASMCARCKGGWPCWCVCVCVHLGEDEFSGYTGTQGVDADEGLLLLWLMSGRKRGETFHPSCAKRSGAFLFFSFLLFFLSYQKKKKLLCYEVKD